MTGLFAALLLALLLILTGCEGESEDASHEQPLEAENEANKAAQGAADFDPDADFWTTTDCSGLPSADDLRLDCQEPSAPWRRTDFTSVALGTAAELEAVWSDAAATKRLAEYIAQTGDPDDHYWGESCQRTAKTLTGRGDMEWVVDNVVYDDPRNPHPTACQYLLDSWFHSRDHDQFWE